MKRLLTAANILLAFVVIKILIHLFTTTQLGFHRDEFLYLELGRHLDWGFWSNPPFIGLVSWCSQHLLGESVFATRLPSALAGGALIWITGQMVRDLGGGRFAQLLCGTGMLFSIAWLRTFSMLQPVPFDVLFWAMLSFAMVKWLKTDDTRWWWWMGAILGIGFLNKYTLVFWVAAFFIALLLTPRREVLLTKAPWLAALLTVLLILPNLLWQWHYNFPVIGHMQELARNQLDHVNPVNFMVDQLMMQGPGGMLLWVAGLFFLLLASSMRRYRLPALFYVAILLIFLALSGKGYYTLGAYPVLMAAGAVFWERFLQKNWSRTLLVAAVALLGIPLLPVGIPIWKADRLVTYFKKLTDKGIVTVRWEGGELHTLPQDYADMLGWPELAGIVERAVETAGLQNCLIYGENYGQAGAVSHLCGAGIRERTVSFSDSYRLWVSETLPPGTNTLIYINDELGEDVQSLFGDIQKAGSIENPLAREYGTSVWICRKPRNDLHAFWQKRVQQIRQIYHLPAE